MDTEQSPAFPHAARNSTPPENEMTASSEPSIQQKPDSSAAAVQLPSLGNALNEKAAPEKPFGQTRKVAGIRWVLMVLSILSSTFLFALDNTVVADVQASIVNTFGQIQKLSWLPLAFLVASIATNSIWYVDRCLEEGLSSCSGYSNFIGAKSIVN